MTDPLGISYVKMTTALQRDEWRIMLDNGPLGPSSTTIYEKITRYGKVRILLERDGSIDINWLSARCIGATTESNYAFELPQNAVYPIPGDAMDIGIWNEEDGVFDFGKYEPKNLGATLAVMELFKLRPQYLSGQELDTDYPDDLLDSPDDWSAVTDDPDFDLASDKCPF